MSTMSESQPVFPLRSVTVSAVWPLLLLCVLIAQLIWSNWPALAYLIPPVERTPFYPFYLARQPAPLALPVPVAGVKPSQIGNSWGAPRGQGRQHQGVDIFARRGTPVLSATEGIVARIGTDPLGGKVVWVLGPGGQRHYYAHLESYADISVGQRVQAGTALGKVGNTGNARTTPPHLHYGIYQHGALNPYPLLQAHASSTSTRQVGKSGQGSVADSADVGTGRSQRQG